ncbi:MAG TPA: PAS domain S-box protein [Bacteroidota bacterium]
MFAFLKGLVSPPELELNVNDHEELLRLILENANDLVAIVDFNGKRLYNNKSYLPILGNPTELKGTSSFEEIHPEDRQKIKQVFDETVRTGEGQKSSYRFVGANGSLRYIESQGRVVPAASRKGGKAIVIISRDVTERTVAEESLRNGERRFRAMIENISDAITLVARDGMVMYSSPAAKKIFSLSDESSHALSVFDMIHPDDYDFARSLFLEVAAEPQKTVTEQLRVKRADGTIGWVESVFTNLLNDTSVQAVVATFRDITDRKQLEDDLRQIQKMESIGRLAGGVAHDFNNILAIMMGYSAAIVRAKGDATKITEHVDVIQKAVQRGASLVRQLLMFARKSEAFFESVNINEVALDAVRMLEEMFPKTIRFSIHLDPELPHVHADPGQVHQTIVNLCVNARDAILDKPRGKAEGGMLSISTDCVTGEKLRTRFSGASEEQYVRLRVTDTGSGMNDITRARMFEPFFTTKANGKGTGLGLSVVFGIMQNHRGFIDVESASEKGSTFYVYFPASEIKQNSVTVENGVNEDELRGSETILVVEDELVLRTLLTSLLESYGYRVITAEDGLKAISVFEQHKHELALVISDLGLPGMSGYDSLQRLKAINGDVPLVLVSGFFDPEMQEEVAQAGIKAFIQKPFVPEKILKTIRQIINQYSLSAAVA